MKKYFNKIIAIPLIIVIFFMASGLCFQGLLNPFFRAQAAQAALLDNQTNEEVNTTEVCSDELIDINTKTEAPDLSIPLTANHHNSILLCCVNGNHFEPVNFFQALDWNKYFSIIVFNQEQLFAKTSELAIYHNPTIPPPKLLAVKTINLRL